MDRRLGISAVWQKSNINTARQIAEYPSGTEVFWLYIESVVISASAAQDNRLTAICNSGVKIKISRAADLGIVIYLQVLSNHVQIAFAHIKFSIGKNDFTICD